MHWDPPSCVICSEGGDVRLRSKMGYPPRRNPLKGTARGDFALVRTFHPNGGAALWEHAKLGPWVGEQKPHGKTLLGATPVPT